ncbi:Kinesin-like protein kin-12f, partial [Thalictrum thalictroides]
MLRDLKLFSRNVGKKMEIGEIENVPLNGTDSSVIQVSSDANREPLHTIQEPTQNPKSVIEQEFVHRNKIDRTPPTKVHGKRAANLLRTPEKQVGFSKRNKFGWAEKNEVGISGTEVRDEEKSDVNNLPPSNRNGGLTNMTPRSVRSVGRNMISNSECGSAQTTPSKSVTKPPNPGFASLHSIKNPMNFGSRAANFAALAKGVPMSSASTLVVNTVEVPHFELREDPSFWMDHNVQVLIRVRPLNGMERSSHGYNRCFKQENSQSIAWIGQPETRFTFDHVACETINQEMLFRVAGLPMVENCLSGYNSCMFAYGQTGSGKTYTMLGEIDDLEVKPSPERGMTPRIFEFLFARIRAEEESRRDEKVKYSCKCSFLEIYNEQICDLLDPSSTNLLLREDIKNGVYVENLTEYEVQTVNDILKLLAEGAANRKVAATNMNRESSRSHSVFTCVIESRWEKESITNLRFARLNLVDLAGSERQKTSGAEGERLKEAANINKSLSTLGHVIMLLVDVAQGKLRHIPYRDSRLTFLLQESLGGNSKTMIIANVSPSICCAAETLSTLKFAQRAKLIQNNAVINEDASGDVSALQLQIQLLKEELSVLKRQKVSRSLSFRLKSLEDTDEEGHVDSSRETSEISHDYADEACQNSAALGIVRVSTKQGVGIKFSCLLITIVVAKILLLYQLKSLEATLAGGSMPSDAYLAEENDALSKELQLLHAKIERNPEVTRFALENIRLLDKLRKFQDFYEEGEREMLSAEVSELRNQLLQFLDGNKEHYVPPNVNISDELKKSNEELELCRHNLSTCLESNSKLTSEIDDLKRQLNSLKSTHHDQDFSVKPMKEPVVEVQAFETNLRQALLEEKVKWKHEIFMEHTEEIMNLQLELDILKAILQEERSSRKEVEERALNLSTDLEMAKARCLEISMHCEDAEEKLKEHSGGKDSTLQFKLKRMQDSLEMAKRMNESYQNNQVSETSNEEERDKVRKQAEAETADVIICFQEELLTLQQQVEVYNRKELETQDSLLFLENELKDMKEKLSLMTRDNKRLNEVVQEKDEELKSLSEEWETLACEIEEVIADGHRSLEVASDQVELVTNSFSSRTWVCQQVGKIISNASEKDLIIDELQKSLEEAQNIRIDMDWKLSSLRGAALAITEVQQQENSGKEKEILHLTAKLSEKSSIITALEERIKIREDQVSRAEKCATVAFVIVSRLSEITSDFYDVSEQKDIQHIESISLILKKDTLIHDQDVVIVGAEKQIESLRKELDDSGETCAMLKQKLSEEEERVHLMEKRLADVEQDIYLKTRETLDEFKLGVSTLNICMDKYAEQVKGVERVQIPRKKDCEYETGDSEAWIAIETSQDMEKKESDVVGDHTNDRTATFFKIEKDLKTLPCDHAYQSSGRTCNDAYNGDRTIILLRKEIESALESLEGVQAQMVKLLQEKEEIRTSEAQCKKSMECFTSQLFALQREICGSEEQFKHSIIQFEQKLQKLEKSTQEAKTSWLQKEEVFDHELGHANVVAKQKSAEAASLVAKFEEAQETIEEANVMVKALVIANDTSKHEIGRLKEMVVSLTRERDFLTKEFKSLQLSDTQKDQLYANLEKQFLELEDIITEVQTDLSDQFESVLSEFHCFKSQILLSTNLTWSWLEDIWSEIIDKDCAVSVLHLCHMGVLLEAVNGLNSENGLLHHGLCESNSHMVDLKEQNIKTRKELDMFRDVKGKLLVDIKNSFDRILRKEYEAGKLSEKLSSFEENLMNLQFQEELMLARSNSMGSELSLLTKELDMHNTKALEALSDQIKLLRDKEELATSRLELLMIDLTAKDFESVILASELLQMGLHKAEMQSEQETFTAFLEEIKKELIYLKVEADLEKQLLMDTEVEVSDLKKVIVETNNDRNDLSQKLKQCSVRLLEMEEEKGVLEEDIQSLKEVACSNTRLKSELVELLETKETLTAKVQLLETETVLHIKDGVNKETALKALICEIQTELDQKDARLNILCCMEKENVTFKDERIKVEADYRKVLDDLQEKKSELEASYSRICDLGQENHILQDKICNLGDCIAILETDSDMKNRELEDLRHSQLTIEEKLDAKGHDLEIQTNIISSLKEDNDSLKSSLMSVQKNSEATLSLINSNVKCCVDSVQAVDDKQRKFFQLLDGRTITLLEKMFHELCENRERASKLIMECEILKGFIEELTLENLSFKNELLRKDELVKGLSFDLSLLQESASIAKDKKDETEELEDAVEHLEEELVLRSTELNEAVIHNQILEAQFQEKCNLISDIELDLFNKSEFLKLLMDEKIELTTQLEAVSLMKGSLEEELKGRNKVIESLEEEIFSMDNSLGQVNTLLEDLKNELNEVTCEKDRLNSEVRVLKEDLEMTQALAEEKEALATEAQQLADSRKTYAEDKEEEVKVLERSVEELENTVNVLENQVHVVKGEAERQRLLREELEAELQIIRNQMLTVTTQETTLDFGTNDTSSRNTHLERHLEEKDRDLQETREQIRILEKNIAEKDAEVSQCRIHISELTLHAEAQAHEYKQKFKALESMADQVKPDPSPSYMTNSSTTKAEKNAAKPRGSGSPFKCIGLGMTQQINSEKDEELTSARRRIEELEALAASRQKEIFLLNTRLATAESMTHDVMRDLLALKLDMTNYASLLDHQQVYKITEKVLVHSESSQEKEQEVIRLKLQLNEFIEERQGWLEEINRRQAEMVAAQIASERLRQRDQFFTTENEMLKKENVSHKKKVMELEDEVKKLTGQQNLHQRIHHHAKIKEENNLLKAQNEELSIKVRKMDVGFSHLKEEIANYRAARGMNCTKDFDEEKQLNNKLKETEEEKLQLAQKLLSLCTSILKAAGITRPAPDVSLSRAEEALDQLKDRIISMERELHDLKFKNKICSERARLTELKQQLSPLSSRTDENSITSDRNEMKLLNSRKGGCNFSMGSSSRCNATLKSDQTVRIGVLGASGYTGSEIVRLLANHPHFDITVLTADRKAGQKIGSVFPHLITQDLPEMVAVKDADFTNVDAVFCCLPHGTTQEIIKALPKSLKIVDLSADFRLRNINEYEEWYGQPHRAPELQKEAVYGLTEILKEEICNARLVANPGCYPTSIQLPLVPLIK